MGRRSRSRSPKKNRKRSRSRDRSHREKDDRSKKSSNLKGMEEARKRLREGLDAANKETMDVPTCASRPFDDLSYAEQASRAREIERIEEGGFQPAQFKSSAGGGRTQKKVNTKAEKIDAAQDQHEKAMFGPAWMNKNIKNEETGIPMPPSVQTRTGPPLLNAKFLVDPEERKAIWLGIWREQRRKMGC